MPQHLLACQQSLGSATSFSLIPFFFPSCLLKVGVHKIFRGSTSEDDIAYTIPPVQVYCATETDILPPEKAKLVMGLNYWTRSTIRLTVWAWSHLGRWAEWKERSNTWNRVGHFCKVIQTNSTFQDGKQKYECFAFWMFLRPSWPFLTSFNFLPSGKKKPQLNEMRNSDVLLNRAVSWAASPAVPPTSAAACHKLNQQQWSHPTPELCHNLFTSCIHSL